jgi:hypothetical protein
MTSKTREEYDSFKRTVVEGRVATAEEAIGSLFRGAPIPDGELVENIGLFNSPRVLKRILFFDEIYRQILPVHGVVLQFGTRWGRDIAIMDSLRTIYEPYNISRKVVGFDTFEGFPAVHEKDGNHAIIHSGALGTAENYVEFLGRLIELRRRLDPLPNLERFEIVKGEAGAQFEAWLERHPEAIIALAHFDMDIYEPTRRCLELLKNRLTKGSVIAFDELNSLECPGETVALREVFGLDRWAIRRSPSHSGQGSWVVVD